MSGKSKRSDILIATRLLPFVISLLPFSNLLSQQTSVNIVVGGKNSYKKIRDGINTDSLIKNKSKIKNSVVEPGNLHELRTSTPITVSITTTGASCNNNNGSVIAFASGGTGPYQYTLSSYWTQNNGNFPAVAGGNYTMTVTDATGQTIFEPVFVSNLYNPPQISVSSYIPASGCATADASITLAVTGGAPPYQYTYDQVNYQSSNTFTNLYPGDYYFTVKDANGCIAVHGSFNEGLLISPTCNYGVGLSYSVYACTNEGEIRLTSYGPNPPYTFSIDGINYQVSGEFSNLVPGKYNCYYKDANGIVRILFATIFKSCPIKIDFISMDAACGQENGTLTVNASLGTAPYSYTIDGINYQTSNVFTGLSPGMFSVTVKDANGMTNYGIGMIDESCLGISLSTTDETCTKNDGVITVTANKGTPPYQYSIDGINFSNNNVFSGLVAGNYTVILKDNLGYTSTASAIINYSCITIAAFGADEICGNKNGSISIIASNGIPPYQYSLDGINFSSTSPFTGLVAGNYIVTVKDFAGQTGTNAVVIANMQGAQITTGITLASCKNDDGSITVSGSGGRIPYQYSIDGINYQLGNLFTNLTPGNYTVYIKDGNACLTSKQATVLQNCPLVTAVVFDETCSSSNGIINVTGSNGKVPYQFSIDGISYQTNTQFAGLKAGNYTITIKDATSITNTTLATIKNICPMVWAIVTDGLCSIASGIITATGMNGTGPYQYSIDGINFQPGNVFSNLSSASYTIYVKDVNGLVNTTSAVVKNFPGPSGTVVSVDASCLANVGKVIINAVGGSAPLQYSLDGINYSANNQFTDIVPASYTVTIKDVNGCIATLPVTVSLNKNITLDAGPDITICEGTTTTLNAVSNGNNFQWTPSSSLNNTSILASSASPVTTTKYYITAQLGICSLVDSVIVNVNPSPIPVAQQSMSICYGQDIQLFGSGGVRYNWSPSTYLNNPSIPDPIAIQPKKTITYHLSVFDGKGCQSLNDVTTTLTVTAPPKIFAGNDTSIVLSQPFQLMAADINNSMFVQYTWSPPIGLNNPFLQNPIAIIDQNSTYIVTAKTAAGCEGNDDIIIKVYKAADIFVPTAFTPNHDGKNDMLRAIPVGIKSFKYFIIYNRWGEKIFYTTNSDKGWDGKYVGISQQSGVFVWLTEGISFDGKTIQKKGTVALIR